MCHRTPANASRVFASSIHAECKPRAFDWLSSLSSNRLETRLRILSFTANNDLIILRRSECKSSGFIEHALSQLYPPRLSRRYSFYFCHLLFRAIRNLLGFLAAFLLVVYFFFVLFSTLFISCLSPKPLQQGAAAHVDLCVLYANGRLNCKSVSCTHCIG